MSSKIGVARALYSYYHYPLFKTFFQTLGVTVFLSTRTTKQILKAGIEHAPAEICLPVKTFIGHIAYLKDKVDFLLIPRLVCTKDSRQIQFGCPKAIGLPDLIRVTFDKLPPIIELNWDERITSLKKELLAIAKTFSKNRRVLKQAYQQAQKAQLVTERLLSQGLTPDQIFEDKLYTDEPKILNSEKNNPGGLASSNDSITVGVVGHRYLLFDTELSLNIVNRLKELGVSVITPTMLSVDIIHNSASKYRTLGVPGSRSGEMCWTYEKEILGSAAHFLNGRKTDGIVLVSSFACGTSAVVNEIIHREVAHTSHTPILTLLLDEHTAEAGIMTRLESFIDLISLSKRK